MKVQYSFFMEGRQAALLLYFLLCSALVAEGPACWDVICLISRWTIPAVAVALHVHICPSFFINCLLLDVHWSIIRRLHWRLLGPWQCSTWESNQRLSGDRFSCLFSMTCCQLCMHPLQFPSQKWTFPLSWCTGSCYRVFSRQYWPEWLFFGLERQYHHLFFILAIDLCNFLKSSRSSYW